MTRRQRPRKIINARDNGQLGGPDVANDKKTAQAWIDSLAHLPVPLRDFHDQKDVFKSIGGMTHGGGDPTVAVSWVDGHCYVVDKFLHFMARHGYTLQRSRSRVDFDDLDATIKARRDIETAALRGHLAMLNREESDS